METLFYIVSSTVGVFLSVIMFAMLGRAILSFLPIDEGAGLPAFLMLITEPIILPVRRVCQAMGLGEGLPFDIPFLITYILLSVLTVFI